MKVYFLKKTIGIFLFSLILSGCSGMTYQRTLIESAQSFSQDTQKLSEEHDAVYFTSDNIDDIVESERMQLNQLVRIQKKYSYTENLDFNHFMQVFGIYTEQLIEADNQHWAIHSFVTSEAFKTLKFMTSQPQIDHARTKLNHTSELASRLNELVGNKPEIFDAALTERQVDPGFKQGLVNGFRKNLPGHMAYTGKLMSEYNYITVNGNRIINILESNTTKWRVKGNKVIIRDKSIDTQVNELMNQIQTHAENIKYFYCMLEPGTQLPLPQNPNDH